MVDDIVVMTKYTDGFIYVNEKCPSYKHMKEKSPIIHRMVETELKKFSNRQHATIPGLFTNEQPKKCRGFTKDKLMNMAQNYLDDARKNWNKGNEHYDTSLGLTSGTTMYHYYNGFTTRILQYNRKNIQLHGYQYLYETTEQAHDRFSGRMLVDVYKYGTLVTRVVLWVGDNSKISITTCLNPKNRLEYLCFNGNTKETYRRNIIYLTLNDIFDTYKCNTFNDLMGLPSKELRKLFVEKPTDEKK
jgi:hypothetical protein